MSTAGMAGSASVSRRLDPFLMAILAVALGLRLYLGFVEPYIHDEINNAIPLANTISFAPSTLHLPLRGENHGALPAYVVKASGAIFGTSPLGYRALHIALGLGTILIVYLLARDWYGPVAARWAAALIAFNGYYLPISARATAHVPFLFLVVSALFAFSRFLRSQQPRHLYLAGAAVGLAFYCKEHAALLVPVFLLTLLHPRLRAWLWRPQPYVAAAIVGLLLAPDVIWNLVTPDTTLVNYGDQEALQAHYTNHLRRIGGLGFSAYPMMFYARAAVRPAYRAVTGRELVDETAEYSSITPLLGVVLVGAVVATTIVVRTPDLARPFLLAAFWFVFGFFTLIARGSPPGRLDPVSWIWVESTMFPAIVLTGARLADARRVRWGLWLVTGGALLYGAVQVLVAATASS